VGVGEGTGEGSTTGVTTGVGSGCGVGVGLGCSGVGLGCGVGDWVASLITGFAWRIYSISFLRPDGIDFNLRLHLILYQMHFSLAFSSIK
jgi:hypothetical protein